MPRFRVIALEKVAAQEYRYVLWADVPPSRQPFYANAEFKSAWKDAVLADNTALQSGQVVERVETIQISPAHTLTQLKSFLAQRATDYQTEITNSNPWLRYGTTYDGTTWVDGGVA